MRIQFGNIVYNQDLMKKIIKKQIKFFGKKKLVLEYIKKQNTKNFKIKYYNELYKFYSLINHMKNV